MTRAFQSAPLTFGPNYGSNSTSSANAPDDLQFSLGLRPDPPQITRLAFHMNHGKERGICSGGGVNS